jgi:methionyl-tRNA synthetase
MIERFNSDLANTLGNLVNRSIAMVHKYFGGIVPACGPLTDFERDLENTALETVRKTDDLISRYRMADAVGAVMDLASRCNKYIDETAPWILAKDESKKDYLGTVMYHLIEGIRFLSVLLQPFMPETAKKIWAQLNIPEQTYASLSTFGGLESGISLSKAEPLFTRIDKEEMLKKIEERIAASQKASAPAIELAPEITIDDFFKTELRAAKVETCEKVKKSKKLLKLQLDDGMGGRQVVSGISQWYSPEDLIGKTVIVVANLKAAKLCGEESCGMIMAADMPDGSAKVVFLPDDVAPGTKLR